MRRRCWRRGAAAVVMLAACSKTPASQVKIGNGAPVEDETTATRAVVLLRHVSEDHEGFCTGTFLNDTTVITAVHCVKDLDTGGMAVKTGDGDYVHSVNVFYNARAGEILRELRPLRRRIATDLREAYREHQTCNGALVDSEYRTLVRRERSLTGELPQHDVALVVFPRGTGDDVTGGRGYYGVASTQPTVGERAMFVGFGQSSTVRERRTQSCSTRLIGQGFGVKRRGFNTIASIDRTKLSTYGFASAEAARERGFELGVRVSTRPGDSGSPWIQCRPSGCDGRRVMAVTSTGTFANEDEETSHGASTVSAEARALFRRAVHCRGEVCAARFVGFEG